MRLPDDFDASDLSDAWTVIWQSDRANEITAELRREMTSGHSLEGVVATAVAIRKLQ
jgi:hypothetical protein